MIFEKKTILGKHLMLEQTVTLRRHAF